MNRSKLREITLKAIYGREAGNADVDKTISMLLDDHVLTPEEEKYITTTVDGIYKHEQEIMQTLENNAQNWKTKRMPLVDLSVLKYGIYELLYRDDIPVGATINECVDLAKEFSTPKSGSFVNGVLSGCNKEISSRNSKPRLLSGLK